MELPPFYFCQITDTESLYFMRTYSTVGMVMGVGLKGVLYAKMVACDKTILHESNFVHAFGEFMNLVTECYLHMCELST